MNLSKRASRFLFTCSSALCIVMYGAIKNLCDRRLTHIIQLLSASYRVILKINPDVTTRFTVHFCYSAYKHDQCYCLCNDNYEDVNVLPNAVEHQEQGLEKRENVAYEFEPWI